jgi:polysaccharide export outer membrane protein
MKNTVLLSMALMYLLSACATNSGTMVTANQCPMPSEHSSEYLIGPGDTLNIIVWRNNELSATVPVRPDGRISTPLIDDMQATGRTPSELAEDMEAVLGEYLRTPEVSVIVTGQGVANQIQVIGEVRSPQSLSYRDGLRLLDVIVAVGGLTDFAAGNRATVVRQSKVNRSEGNVARLPEARQFECRVKINDLMKGDMSQNINMYPGDVIVIPETMF